MRKKAQERKMSMSPSSSSSSLTYQSCLLDTAPIIGMGSGDTHNGITLLGIDEAKGKASSSLPCPLQKTAMWDYKCPEVLQPSRIH
uniref:Uncharacterized protein n=1 Tax=Arundo donax TaxID=35708 RepID=A0A0A9CL60_ARUDO